MPQDAFLNSLGQLDRLQADCRLTRHAPSSIVAAAPTKQKHQQAKTCSSCFVGPASHIRTPIFAVCSIVQVAQVLSLVVQHTTAASLRQHQLGLAAVCTLLQTKSIVRSTLQRTQAECSVKLFCRRHVGPTQQELPRAALSAPREQWLASFTAWLPRHASLLSCLDCGDIGIAVTSACLQQCVALLKLCRLQAAHEGLMPLRLRVLEAVESPQPALVQEVAYLHLQTLKLVATEHLDPAMGRICAGLQKPTTLQRLGLWGADDVPAGTDSSDTLAGDCVAAALAQLAQLTYLEFSHLRSECADRLPVSLQELVLQPSASVVGLNVVDLRHLTALQRLLWSDNAKVYAEVALPPHLTSLGTVEDFTYSVPARLTCALGLQLISANVDLCTDFDGLRFFQCLSRLPSLSELRVKLTGKIGRVAASVNAVGLYAALQQASNSFSNCYAPCVFGTAGLAVYACCELGPGFWSVD